MQKGYNCVRYKELVIGVLYQTNVCIINRETRQIELNTGGHWTRATLKAINSTLHNALEPFTIIGKLNDCQLIITPRDELKCPIFLEVGADWARFLVSGEVWTVVGIDGVKGFGQASPRRAEGVA